MRRDENERPPAAYTNVTDDDWVTTTAADKAYRLEVWRQEVNRRVHCRQHGSYRETKPESLWEQAGSQP